MKLLLNRWLVVLIIFMISVAIQSHLFLSWDVLWLLEITHRWLHGGQYFHNFMDMDPPMILYLYALPQWLSQQWHLSLVVVFRVYVYIICWLSLIFSSILLNKLFNFKKNGAIFLLALSFCYFLLSSYIFGQREFLMLVLVVPYLLVVDLRLHDKNISKKISFFSGVMAGLGFAIKPHFLLTFLLVELFYIFRKKRFFSWVRLESLTVIGVCVIYVILLLVFDRTFITLMLPYVTHLYINIERLPLIDLLFNNWTLIWLVALFYFVILRKKFHDCDSILIFLIAATGMMIVYCWEGWVWYYHVYPVIAFSSLALLFMVFELLQLLKQSRWTKISYGITLYTIFIFLILFPLYITYEANIHKLFERQKGGLSQIIDVTKKYANGGPIYFFSTNMTLYTPAYYVHKSYPYLYSHSWMLKGLVYSAQRKLTPQQKLFYDQFKVAQFNMVVNDFKKYPPAVVLVEENDLMPVTSQGIVEYFLQDPRFVSIWSHYVFLRQIVVTEDKKYYINIYVRRN